MTMSRNINYSENRNEVLALAEVPQFHLPSRALSQNDNGHSTHYHKFTKCHVKGQQQNFRLLGPIAPTPLNFNERLTPGINL